MKLMLVGFVKFWWVYLGYKYILLVFKFIVKSNYESLNID